MTNLSGRPSRSFVLLMRFVADQPSFRCRLLKVNMNHPTSEITRSSTATEIQGLIDDAIALYTGGGSEERGTPPASPRQGPAPVAPAPATTGVSAAPSTCLAGAVKNKLNLVVGDGACCTGVFRCQFRVASPSFPPRVGRRLRFYLHVAARVCFLLSRPLAPGPGHH